jgi:polar amino acid transport system substrate-binding protein
VAVPEEAMVRNSRGWRVVVAIAMFSALTVAGCSKGDEGSGPPCVPPVKPAKVDEIAKLLPDNVAKAGKLVVGVDATYPPNEFKDKDGNVIGFDVDLLNAVAAPLGVTLDCRVSAFDKIIPSIGKTYDMGMSSLTDNKEREQQVDFVDYFIAGTLWAQRPGAPIDPENPCGKKVAVQTGTIQADELTVKNDTCVKAGKPEINIVKFDGQDAVNNALTLGQADAMTADYPVTAYAIKNSAGKLEAAGEQFETAPYGWAVAKGSALGPALLKSLEHIIQTGEYSQVLAKWGVEKGAIPKPGINGAVG